MAMKGDTACLAGIACGPMTLTTRLIVAHTDAIGEGAKPVFKYCGGNSHQLWHIPRLWVRQLLAGWAAYGVPLSCLTKHVL
ncbi:hypothetical protein M752DRAFT_155698 [Aspergillus phoenicis ATCC 13157]|uniref:Uncharacterized protein n=2 Tax=Aspergillus TaxID=5052 RepID=A0A370PM85_ASPPH|nr:hypothetical protein M747DRAFT_108513 [Aspergillus niger ATCC 13496]RDK43302.1 hypothetical protein M752DRAFT_155698 [Aspergillus phoenicis ATCC 13157]